MNNGVVTNKKLVIHRAGQCVGYKNLPIYLPDMRVEPYNSTLKQMAVSGYTVFREDFPNGWKVSVSIKKCDDFRATANCRAVLNNIANSDACTLLRVGAMYMKYMENMKPKMACPFRAGNYTYEKTLVDDDLIRFMPGSGKTFWDIEVIGRVKERIVTCIQLQFKVIPKRGS
ncbi:uncharacterized protein LOC129752372 [Uranotaenia lowii]|uniref:uncharacterized protein LOC129752372 n=1 Tax=Uranotaenia lowii TaxID=190385 RepID=UPI0024798AAE|nr:uncharacterized protein LOC129752372 [Uranotaenia lowii]